MGGFIFTQILATVVLRYAYNLPTDAILQGLRLRAGEDISGKFSALFKHEEEKRLEASEEMLDVLESVLKKPEVGRL